MPLKRSTFDAVCAGLRHSAERGHFVPRSWIKSIDTLPDNSVIARGCGWGLIGWHVSVHLKGVDWTRKRFPVSHIQLEDINHVLMLLGLTKAEIEDLNQEEVYKVFDKKLSLAYDRRGD